MPSKKNTSRKKTGQQLLADIGEDELVDRLLKSFPVPPVVEVGPGDDCAVVARPGGKLLLKVDSLHEGVHFLRTHPPRAVGWKALARPLSDIAAMAGIPKYALVAIAAPQDLPVRYLEEMYAGIRRIAGEFSVALVGGETSRSPTGLFVSVTVVGETRRANPAIRSGARDGDAIWVTGKLGGSYKSGRHLRFRPRLAEAQWLADVARPTAMMDLSDGLGADLPRLARRSGLGFLLQEERIPRAAGCDLAGVLGDGEDYELLFTIPPGRSVRLLEKWRQAFPRVPLTEIGVMRTDGARECSSQGFRHF
jgi:thiamine-monophosphate kinase